MSNTKRCCSIVIIPSAVLFCSFLLQGCASSGHISNVYRVNARVDGFQSENAVGGTPSYAPRNSYYSLIGSQNGKTIVSFFEFDPSVAALPGRVQKDELYSIDDLELSEGFKTSFRRGLNTGTLIIPFKYRPARVGNPANMFGSSSLGPYLGYRFGFGVGANFDITPLVFAGFSSVTTSDVNTKDVDNLLGYTYGGGINFAIGKDFQLGLVAGGDFIGGKGGDAWPYRNAIWYSFAIGYKFLSF